MTLQAEHLKVGLVSPYGWTSRWGINRHIGGLAAALSDRGHDVTVIVPAEVRDEARASRRGRKRAVRRGDLMTGPGAGNNDNLPYRVLKVEGTFRVPYSDSTANLALPNDIADRMNDLLASEQFDVLHLHEPYPPSLPFTALRLAHCPAIATFHTGGERLLSYQLMRPVVDRYFARLDGRICTSQHTRRIVSGYFPGDYEVIGSGVDTARFSPPENPATSEARPLVVFAAFSEPRKSLGLLLRTMRLLPEDVPPFELAVVGGEDLLWRGNLVVPRRLRDRVAFAGQAGHERLPELYRRAEVMCAPYAACSQSASLLEAMAAAAAIIVPGRGGIRELVGEAQEGLLLDHPYSYNLAANLMDLLVNPGLRHSLGAAASVKAKRYSWDDVAPQVEAACRKAHRRRRRPEPLTEAVESVGNSGIIFADLHTHTCYSHDCATTPEELLAACEQAGIEAVAITDHNTIEGALEVSRLAPDHIHVVVGEEIKTSDGGEIIGLYLKDEIPGGLAAEETIRRIKAQGGLVYVPHPFDPLHLTPAYELLARNAADIDIIEVYNPRITFAAFNEKARRLARKYGIPAGAGSDCHVVQGVGTAMLSLRKFQNPQELLASLGEADVVRSRKNPIYLHSLKLLKNGRGMVGTRE